MSKNRMQHRDIARARLGTLRWSLLLVGLVALPSLAADAPPPRIPPADDAPADAPPPDAAPKTGENRQKPPVVAGNAKINIDFVDTPITDLVKYMAEITGRNFILGDKLSGKITIISHKPVTVAEAYEAFLSALSVAGYTTVTSGQATTIVALGDASSTPLHVYEGDSIPYTDNFVTQIIQLENVSVSDMTTVVQGLASKAAKIIPYAATNTLIITDAGSNIRKIYGIISKLDVASPKAKLEIIPLQNAQASDVKTLIEQLYNVNSSSSSASSSSSSGSASDRISSRRRRREAAAEDAPAPSSASVTTAGQEPKFIEKVLADERTNSIIVMANEEALEAIKALIAQLDVDVDPTSRAQIHVIYLEHAKAEDVAQVLSQLSEGGTSSSRSSSSSTSRSAQNARNQATSRARAGQQQGGQQAEGGGDEGPFSNGTSAVAAFDSGVRITSDENTNSLVIIATPDQFSILKQVIDKLDIRRKQVVIDAVILEMATTESNDVGLGYHFGSVNEDTGTTSIASNQMGASSLGLSSDVLSGMALGVFGQSFPVTIPDLTGAGNDVTLNIPAFGVALQALQSNSAVDILSAPTLMTMDNEEAKIIVGRNIPFPSSASYSSISNTPVISYQREDVALTLKVTPQINESNFVTLEVFQEVTEVEDNALGLDPTTAGFVTSKRSAETTVVVKDNQTVVIGGLIGATDTETHSKVPVLGDLPLIGRLFRSKSIESRKTNLLIFLTPHVISDPEDLEEVYRIKVAQREQFIKMFYGKSREEQEKQLASLLQYSLNEIDKPSPYRTKADASSNVTTIGDGDTTTAPTDATTPEDATTPAPALPEPEDDNPPSPDLPAPDLNPDQGD